MNRMKREDGWVIVVAMAVMALILLVGLATLKYVDSQSGQSGRERVRESSFNFAEGLLYAQAATLRSNWPTKAPCGTPAGSNCGYVPTCQATGINATTAALQCPDVSGSLAGNQKVFNNQDTDGNTSLQSWTVQVRDDVGAKKGGGAYTPDPIYKKGDESTTGCTTQTAPASGVAPQLCVDMKYPAGLPTGYQSSDQDCGGQICTWDANGNNRLWVRVDAVLKNNATGQTQTRSIVALLKLENFNIPFANNAVVGGTVQVNDNGNKTIVDTQGSQVITRCPSLSPSTTITQNWSSGTSVTVANPAGFTKGQSISVDTDAANYEVMTVSNSYVNGANPVLFSSAPTKSHTSGARIQIQPSAGSTCQGWIPGKTQVSPAGSFYNDPSYPNALGAGSLAALQAGADTTWTNTCPNTAAEWSGKVFITQTPAAGCTMDPSGNGDVNSPTKPGYIVVLNGTLTVKANAKYYGVIYMANQQNSCGTVLDLSGNPTVQGGVAVDGCGGVILGSGKGNEASVVYDKNAFKVFGAVGAAGLVQNTWRELATGQ